MEWRDGRALSLISRTFISSAVVVTLAGCAADHYMYDKEYDLSGQNKAIAVDAKQRFVFTKPSEDGDLFGSVCAEPSPDALSSMVSGATIGAFTGKESLKLALSNAESAASIGLRTQSIQLLRDGMYRICEAAYSGTIGKDEVNALLKRYQDTMVAILAIESLTGAVKANQVVLSGKSSSQIGQNLDELSKLYTKSLGEEQTAKTALDKAKETAETKENEKTSAKTKLDGALTTLTEANKPTCENADDPETLTPDALKNNCKAYLTAKKDFEEAEAASKKANDDQKLAQQQYDVVNKTLEQQKKLFESAASAGSSTAEGSGKFDTSTTTTTKLSDESAEHISKAVVQIVEQSLLRGDVIDKCLKIYERLVDVEIKEQQASMTAVEKENEKEILNIQLVAGQNRIDEIRNLLSEIKDEKSSEIPKYTKERAEKEKLIKELSTKIREADKAAKNAKAEELARKENVRTLSEFRNSLACDDILKAYAKKLASVSVASDKDGN